MLRDSGVSLRWPSVNWNNGSGGSNRTSCGFVCLFVCFLSEFNTWRFSKVQTRDRLFETLRMIWDTCEFILNGHFKVTYYCTSLCSEGIPKKKKRHCSRILETVVIFRCGIWCVEFDRWEESLTCERVKLLFTFEWVVPLACCTQDTRRSPTWLEDSLLLVLSPTPPPSLS